MSHTSKGGVSFGNFKHHEKFVISGKEQVEMFVNAIEESAKNRPVRNPVNVKFIETEDELREFMRFRKMKEKEKFNANNG